MLSRYMVVCRAVLASVLLVALVGCGGGKQKKSEDLAKQSAELSAQMQKEIQASPDKAAEIQAKYQKQIDDLAKQGQALSK